MQDVPQPHMETRVVRQVRLDSPRFRFNNLSLNMLPVVRRSILLPNFRHRLDHQEARS
jgi:hypothetical protein